MPKVTVINIDWSDRIDFENIKKRNAKDDFGLYQIYGHHPAYGDDSLLYIGQTKELFSTRLSNRNEFIESSARPTLIRFGSIVQSSSDTEKLEWDSNRLNEMIDIAEQLLIKSHTPAMNKQHISGLFTDKINEEDFLIINWNDYGKLLPEVSTLRMSYRYWKYELPVSKMTGV